MKYLIKHNIVDNIEHEFAVYFSNSTMQYYIIVDNVKTLEYIIENSKLKMLNDYTSKLTCHIKQGKEIALRPMSKTKMIYDVIISKTIYKKTKIKITIEDFTYNYWKKNKWIA